MIVESSRFKVFSSQFPVLSLEVTGAVYWAEVRFPAVAMSQARLREIPRIRQHADEPQRRWFSCANADLYVWAKGDAYLAFEFCYDKPHDEHSLRWKRESGFSHTRVDDGEASPISNRTPILVPNGLVDLRTIALEFESVAAQLDPRVFRFVLTALYS